MNRLKIAVVVGQFPTVSETFIINQIGFLKEQGHHIDILCLGKKKANFFKNKTIDYYNLMDDVFLFTWRSIMPLNKFKRLLKVFTILFKSFGTRVWYKLIVSLNPFKFKTNTINFNIFFRVYFEYYFLLNNYDVVHVHFADNAVHIKKLLTHHYKKTVVTFHGYDAHNFDSNFYAPLLKIQNLKCTVNTKFTLQQVLKLGFLKPNVIILPVGLDTTYFKPEKIAHKNFNVLFVGRLIEFKAPLLAIKIVKKLIDLGHSKLHLYIIGEGKEFDTCTDFIKNNSLSHFITLLKSKTQNEIIDFMNKSDVFLLPGIIDSKGRCENQGLVLQEAQAMKLPVIISDVGGMQEGIIPNKTGFVVKEKDIEAFTERILELINDSEKKIKMGEAARQFVVEKYDNSLLGDQLLKVYST